MTKNDEYRETKTSYRNIFKRRNQIRLRLNSKKFSIKASPDDPVNLLKAHNILQLISSMLKDEVITINQIDSNLVRSSYERGYVVLPEMLNTKEKAIFNHSMTNLYIKQEVTKTKTFYECFLEKIEEYRNQETVIPYQSDKLKAGSIITYENYIKRLEYFFDIEVGKLTVQDVEKFIRRHIAQKNTYKYVNEMLRPLKEIIQSHVDFGIIKVNVLNNSALINLMRKNLCRSEKYAELLTDDEVKKIISSENCQMKFMVLFGLFTGARVGESMAITWSQNDIHIHENRITISKQYTSEVESTPKSINSIRDIPIIMKSKHLNYVDVFDERTLFNVLLHFYNKTKITKEVFYDQNSKERWKNSDAVNYRMKQFLHSLGIYRHVTFHDLRHWFTAYSVDKNGLKLTSQYLGHSSTKETHDYYLKIKPERKMDFKAAQKYLVFKKRK